MQNAKFRNHFILHSAFIILHSPKGPWCERWPSNPHGFGPLDPKSSASANSATFAEMRTGGCVLSPRYPNVKRGLKTTESSVLITVLRELVPPLGLEPRTNRLRVCCSTN